MRRYPCNKGELTLIHIRVSSACKQILRRSLKVMREMDVKLREREICYILLHGKYLKYGNKYARARKAEGK